MEQTDITLLSNMTDETDESVLSAYFDLAGQKILNHLYPFVEDLSDKEVPSKYHSEQIAITAYLLNKRGAEGELHHSENGTLRIYDSADIPSDMLKTIVPKVGVI